MRESFSDEELQSIAAKQPATQSSPGRVSLKDVLAVKPQYNQAAPEPEPETSETDPSETEPSTGTSGNGGSATFEEPATEPAPGNFDDFAERIENTLDEEDAIEIAKMFVSIGNIFRMIFLPGLYEGFTYPGQERNDIRGVVLKTIENKKQNKEPNDAFNDYENELWAKWPKLRKAIENVSYTQPEIDTFSKYLAREIGEMTVGVWVKKHMWMLYFLYLETTHAQPVVDARVTSWFNKKFGVGKK